MHEDRDHAPGEEPRESLDAREAARARRRDHDLERRDLMRPGMGKVFKQILDRQAREAAVPSRHRHRAKG
jgi:hypothetical protein